MFYWIRPRGETSKKARNKQKLPNRTLPTNTGYRTAIRIFWRGGIFFSYLFLFFFFFFLLHLQSIVCICFVFVWLVPILFNLAISIPLFLFPFFLSFFFYHVPTSLFLLLLLPWTEAPEYCALCYVAYSFLYYAWWIESFTSCYGCIVIPEDLNGRLI